MGNFIPKGFAKTFWAMRSLSSPCDAVGNTLMQNDYIMASCWCEWLAGPPTRLRAEGTPDSGCCSSHGRRIRPLVVSRKGQICWKRISQLNLFVLKEKTYFDSHSFRCFFSFIYLLLPYHWFSVQCLFFFFFYLRFCSATLDLVRVEFTSQGKTGLLLV